MRNKVGLETSGNSRGNFRKFLTKFSFLRNEKVILVGYYGLPLQFLEISMEISQEIPLQTWGRGHRGKN